MNENIASALSPKFQFEIQNNDQNARKVAIIPGYLSTDDYIAKLDNSDVTITKINSSPKSLKRAGFNVDCVLADEEAIVEGTKSTIAMKPGNPDYSIMNLREYIKTNPSVLKKMTIVSNDQTAFDTDMEITELNPFDKNKQQTLDLSNFFDRYQYQSDRIDLLFKETGLELSDTLLWIVTIPSTCTMKFILYFEE